MSRDSVFELLADLLGPFAPADPTGGPATSATSATSEQRRGFPGDRPTGDTRRQVATVAEVSPPVAACRQSSKRPESEHWRGLSPTSPLSPGSTRATIIGDRLVRWGWPADLAAVTAARIAARHADDDRRTCPECAHYRPGRCGRHRAAGLLYPDLGAELASLPQRCPGHLEANHHAKP